MLVSPTQFVNHHELQNKNHCRCSDPHRMVEDVVLVVVMVVVVVMLMVVMVVMVVMVICVW